MINITNPENCCGCTACVYTCSHKCISLFEDEEGFLYPSVDASLCVECGACEKVCPLLNRNTPKPFFKVLAVKSNRDSLKMKSSSGGVFYLLAEAIVNDGGVVFGTVLDDNYEAYIRSAQTLEEILPMMGSKYMQSRVGTTFKEAEAFLKQNRKVLFVGTSCQVAGLKRFLKKDYPNLYAVDILCYGVPSPLVWRRYLSDLTYGRPEEVTSVDFRNKSLNGWSNYSLVVKGKDMVFLSENHTKNPFMNGFELYMRPSCFKCKCKNGRSGSDLTLGDFWGIKDLIPDFYDEKGIGVVLISSEKGNALVSSLDLTVRLSSYEDASKWNGGFSEHFLMPKERAAFFKALHHGKKVECVINNILYPPSKWKRFVRFFTNRFNS